MILVEITIPVLDERDDFELDENVPVGQIIAELAEMLSKKTKSSLPTPVWQEADPAFLLCSLEREEALDPAESLRANGIRDGQTLLLI